MQNDLTSLAKKKEGERFKIGMWWYVVKNGRILRART